MTTARPSAHVIDLTCGEAEAIRMAFLMTHYRQPCEIGPAKLAEARKVVRRFALACTPCLDPPPLELIETLSNDLNTPGCLGLMHGYRARKEGKKLFASMRFLGFWGQARGLDELKTFPPDHMFSAPQMIGLDALGEA